MALIRNVAINSFCCSFCPSVVSNDNYSCGLSAFMRHRKEREERERLIIIASYGEHSTPTDSQLAEEGGSTKSRRRLRKKVLDGQIYEHKASEGHIFTSGEAPWSKYFARKIFAIPV